MRVRVHRAETRHGQEFGVLFGWPEDEPRDLYCLDQAWYVKRIAEELAARQEPVLVDLPAWRWSPVEEAMGAGE